jgi:hypothetical protein
MVFAPQQDWSYVESRSRQSEAARLRAMGPADRFAVYADMYNLLWAARRKISGDWQRLDQRRWKEKLAMRLRMVEAFTKRDQSRRE